MTSISTGGLPAQHARSIEQITQEAADFEYSNYVHLRNWLRTARQIRQQAEIYEAEGNLQQAYLLYYRQAILVLEHLQNHPEVKLSTYNRTLLRAAKKDVELSLNRLEIIKPYVKDEYERYLRRQEEITQRRRDAEKRTSYRSQSRLASTPSPQSSRPPSASYGDPYSAVYYEGHKHPELALQVAQQAQQYPGSAQAPPRTNRTQRYSGEDFNLSQDMQNIRLHLDGKQQPSQSLPSTQSRIRESRSSGRTEYPSVPSAQQAYDSGLETQWNHDSNHQQDLQQAPGRPEKIPIRNQDQQPPARPPKEGYIEPSAEAWPTPNSQLLAAPSLPPKTAVPNDVPQVTQPAQQVFKPSAFLENGVPLRTVFFPPALRRDFLRLARANTSKKLETCGILCGFLKNNGLFISSLVVPEQTSTSDTCEMTLEGEIALFDWVDSRDLLTLGWIHTHPTQTCFMSSRDLHTHCGYQSMIQESIAVVCAPSISKGNGDTDYGIFRLTEPPGMQCIRKCSDSRVFHPHNVENIYTDCQRPGHVVELEGLTYQVHDLRESKS